MSTPRVVLVTFIGTRRTIDAAANAELSLRDLLGPVQELLGVDITTTGPGATAVRLLASGDDARADPSDLGRSLADLGAVDGDVVTFGPHPITTVALWRDPRSLPAGDR